MKIKGNLILKENTKYSESIEVEGNIICEGGLWDLTVMGGIDAGDIHAWNIHARNIDAWNIDAGDIRARDIRARDIHAWNIHARNIDAWDIICEKVKLKKGGKVKAGVFVERRSELERKVWREASA